MAVLREATEELTELTAPDPSLPPLEPARRQPRRVPRLRRGARDRLPAIFRTGGGGDPDIRAALDGPEQRIDEDGGRRPRGLGALARSAPSRSPALEAAVQGWLFFVEGAVLRWLEQRDLQARAAARAAARSALLGSITAARGV